MKNGVRTMFLVLGALVTLGQTAMALEPSHKVRSTAFGVVESFKDGDVTCHVYSGKRYDSIGGISCKGKLEKPEEAKEKSFETVYGDVERIRSGANVCYIYSGRYHDSIGGVSCLD